MKLTTPI